MAVRIYGICEDCGDEIQECHRPMCEEWPNSCTHEHCTSCGGEMLRCEYCGAAIEADADGICGCERSEAAEDESSTREESPTSSSPQLSALLRGWVFDELRERATAAWLRELRREQSVSALAQNNRIRALWTRWVRITDAIDTAEGRAGCENCGEIFDVRELDGMRMCAPCRRAGLAHGHVHVGHDDEPIAECPLCR